MEDMLPLCCTHLSDSESEDEQSILPLARPPAVPQGPIKRCLINIDLQKDFISGSMPLKDAEAIIPIINTLAKEKFDLMVYSLDSHPEDHISFVDNTALYTSVDTGLGIGRQPDTFNVGDSLVVSSHRYGLITQRLWPRHCVRSTEGARLWPALELPLTAVLVQKGTESEVESYTVFGNPAMQYDTGLHHLLHNFGITHIYLTGLPEDRCVAHSASEAIMHYNQVTVIEDAVRGVHEDLCAVMKEMIVSEGGRYMSSEEVIHEIKSCH